MNKDIALYLGGKKVDWTKTPDILLTYERTSYLNPTETKNMFSKSLTLEATPNNNNIFNHIWQLDRIMDDNFTLFNPSQRVDFELYNGAEKVDCGYCKLNSIKKDNMNKMSYSVTLYGSIGSFFYGLAYDINTDKEKTLVDLNFTNTSTPDDEFNFTISKETVKEAWNALQHYGSNTGSNKKWDCVNFMVSYEGYPEDFDADRALINTHGLKGMQVRYTDDNSIVNSSFPMSITDGENVFTPINGYITADLTRNVSATELRDLRSYLQRPCLSIKAFFDAICNPVNNGGYNVVLDNFFTSGNPYYSKAWMTLPMLNPENDNSDNYQHWDWFVDDTYSFVGDGVKKMKWKIASIEPIIGTPDAFSMEVEIHTTVTGTTADKLYTSALNNNGYDPEYIYDPDDPTYFEQLFYYGCTAIQMYGFGNGGIWYTKDAKCGSPLIVLTSKLNGQYIGTNSINTWYSNRPYPDGGIQYNFGYWKKVSGSDYVWHNETDNTDTVKFYMDTNLMSMIPNIGFGFGNIMIMNGALVYQKCGCVYDSQYYDYYGAMNQGTHTMWRNISFTDLDSEIIFRVGDNMRSYKPVTKKDLLGGVDCSPFKLLLSYMKLFGLFIEQDKHSKTIYIKMRNNWYQNEIVDIENLIDRSKEINVTPLTFESKWYNFSYEEANGKFLDRYKAEWSNDFGTQKIDTKYNFDGENVELLEDNIFRNGLTALEKSNYYNNKTDVNGNRIPICLYDWVVATYYHNGDTLETNMCLPQQTIMTELNPLTPKEFYDVMPKLQIKSEENGTVDGDRILVFFNGMRNTGDADYWLSDDIDEMFYDNNDNPCWLQTRHEWNAAWTDRIAIQTNTLPDFSRYVVHNNTIGCTWDFGYTKELYVPYYRFETNQTPTLYQNFWKSYISDLYSVNTRIADCYVRLNDNNIQDFMKKFFWFDNCLWVCTKVTDYDIALEKSTKCSFTKVNDMMAYLEMPTFDDNFFNFYRNDGGNNIPAQGTAEERSFTFNLDCSTDWVVTDNGAGFAQFDPNYPTNGSFGMGYTIRATYEPNYSQSPRYCLYIADNGQGEQRMIRVWQNGYVKEKYLNVTPNSIVFPNTVHNGTQVTVSSSADWYLTAPLWIVTPPHSTSSGDTTLTISAETNTTGAERSGQVTFTNEDGLSKVLTVRQLALPNVSLEQNEIFPVYTVPASGGNVFYRLVNDIECTVIPLGNTANYAVASGQVTYNTTIQPQNGMNFWIHFSPNTGTVSRNAAFCASFVDNGGRYTVYPTVVPLPLEQLASGMTITQYQSKEYTGSTSLGASLPWTATTNNSWINILTPTGSSSTHSVQYVVSMNNGGFRKGYIYIRYKDEMGYFCNETIEIDQEGIEQPWVVSPTGITVDYGGGDYLFSVTSMTQYNASSSKADVEDLNTGVFKVHVDENTGYDRDINVVVSADGETKTVVIHQGSMYPSEYDLDFMPQGIVFDASGGTMEITIRSKSPWTITEGFSQE